MTSYFVAPRYVTGHGAIEQLSALGAQRPLLLVAERVRRDARVTRIEEELAKNGRPAPVVVVPSGPPTLAAADRLAPEVERGGPDWIVAVGGGRTLDLARAAWVRYERPELSLAEVSPLTELGLRRRARFVAVPSTAGSGAESSGVLRLEDDGRAPVRPVSRELVPDWALIDPYLPATAPPPVRADAFAVALGHALEAMVSPWADAFAEAMARRAVAALLRSAVRSSRELLEEEPTEAVPVAAAMAGLAAANAQDGAAAALADGLAEAVDLPYGRRIAAALPVMLEFQFPSARDAYQSLAPEVGVPIAHRSELARRVRTAWTALGLPVSLAAAGVDAGAVRARREAVVARAGRDPSALSSPRIPSAEEWGRLVDCCLTGEPVSF